MARSKAKPSKKGKQLKPKGKKRGREKAADDSLDAESQGTELVINSSVADNDSPAHSIAPNSPASDSTVITSKDSQYQDGGEPEKKKTRRESHILLSDTEQDVLFE